jgi:hypothetical protein
MASFAVTVCSCSVACIPTNASAVGVLLDGTSQGLNGIPTVTLGFIVYLHLHNKQACYRRPVGNRFKATKHAYVLQILLPVCM